MEGGEALDFIAIGVNARLAKDPAVESAWNALARGEEGGTAFAKLINATASSSSRAFNESREEFE